MLSGIATLVVLVVRVPAPASAEESFTAELTALVGPLQQQVQENAQRLAELRTLLGKMDQEMAAGRQKIKVLEAEPEQVTPYLVGGPAIYVLGPEPRDQFVAGIAPLPSEENGPPPSSVKTGYGPVLRRLDSASPPG